MTPCNCSDYPETKPLYYDDVKSGLLKLVKEENEPGLETVFLQCTQCGTNWKFTRDDSYHHVIVDWDRVK